MLVILQNLCQLLTLLHPVNFEIPTQYRVDYIGWVVFSIFIQLKVL